MKNQTWRPSRFVFVVVAITIFHTTIVVKYASAFKLSSLLNGGGTDVGGGDDNNIILTHPRRNLIEEFGEEEYKRKLADAFGEPYVPPPLPAAPASCPSPEEDGEGGGSSCTEAQEKDEEKEKETDSSTTTETTTKLEYGVDISFPIHRHTVSDNYAWLDHNMEPESYSVSPHYKDMPLQPLGDKQKFYDDMIEGCRRKYGKDWRRCDQTERDRIDMNLRQPQSMQNYTDIGFKKIRAPPDVFHLISEFWEHNKDRQEEEDWPIGNTYTNHWTVPTYMLNVEKTSFVGGGRQLKNKIWDAARETIQAWTGAANLTPSSLYGIRVYKEGAVLASHVDRLPLVSSAIINVAQDVDEEWPIEVYAHDGKAYNVTMKPGDMVLYESHSIVHGRPFPLKGRYYANVFIHFEPTGHSSRHEARLNGEEDVEDNEEKEDDDDLPSYIMKGSLEEKRWREKNGRRREEVQEEEQYTTGSTTAHMAASLGDINRLTKIGIENPSLLHTKDTNGWQPLHEAVRSGQTDVVEFLVKVHNANVNERAHDGYGSSPLYLAEMTLGVNHDMVRVLKEFGAAKVGPEV